MISPIIVPPCACLAESWPEDGWGEWERDEPLRGNPRYVRLMLDACGRDCNVWDSEGSSSCVWTLPVSRELVDAIQRWSADHADAEGWVRGGTLYAEASEDYPLDLMNRRGVALAQRLRAELSDEWTVEFVPLVAIAATSPVRPVRSPVPPGSRDRRSRRRP